MSELRDPKEPKVSRRRLQRTRPQRLAGIVARVGAESHARGRASALLLARKDLPAELIEEIAQRNRF